MSDLKRRIKATNILNSAVNAINVRLHEAINFGDYKLTKKNRPTAGTQRIIDQIIRVACREADDGIVGEVRGEIKYYPESADLRVLYTGWDSEQRLSYVDTQIDFYKFDKLGQTTVVHSAPKNTEHSENAIKNTHNRLDAIEAQIKALRKEESVLEDSLDDIWNW